MTTFTEIIEQVDNLSKDEILNAAIETRKEHDEGKTIILSSPEEIRSYFVKFFED